MNPKGFFAAAALALSSVGASAQHVHFGVGYGYGHGYAHPYPRSPGFRDSARGWIGPWWPAPYLTLWIAGAPFYYANGTYYEPVGDRGYRVVAPPPGWEEAQIAAQEQAQPAPVPTKPDPVIYPRQSQTPAQTEADRQDCNRWATTQPAAMRDAGVFQRAVEACMDGRGYTMR